MIWGSSWGRGFRFHCLEDFFVQMPCYSPGRARMEVTGREPYTTVKRVVEDGVEEQPSYPSLEDVYVYTSIHLHVYIYIYIYIYPEVPLYLKIRYIP